MGDCVLLNVRAGGASHAVFFAAWRNPCGVKVGEATRDECVFGIGAGEKRAAIGGRGESVGWRELMAPHFASNSLRPLSRSG